MNTRTNVIPFHFEQHDVRVLLSDDGEPLFVARDVCRALGIETPQRAYARLDEDEKGVRQTHTLGGAQSVTVVNEAGLYSLIFQSEKPAAKPFRRWITHEVLPSLRRTGRYELGARDAVTPSRAAPRYADLDADARTATNRKANDIAQALFRRAQQEFGAMFSALGLTAEQIHKVDAAALSHSHLPDLVGENLLGHTRSAAVVPFPAARRTTPAEPAPRRVDRTASERQKRYRARKRAAALATPQLPVDD